MSNTVDNNVNILRNIIYYTVLGSEQDVYNRKVYKNMTIYACPTRFDYCQGLFSGYNILLIYLVWAALFYFVQSDIPVVLALNAEAPWLILMVSALVLIPSQLCDVTMHGIMSTVSIMFESCQRLNQNVTS